MTAENSFYTVEELTALGLRAFGDGVLISRRAALHGPERISLGSHVRIDDFVVLTSGGEGSVEIGDHVHVAAHAGLFGGGSLVIGDFASVSGRSSLYSASDDYGGDFLVNPTIPEEFTRVKCAPVVLERHVLLGAGSVVLPGVRIGEGSATGALTLVTEDLPPWGIYVGSPARLLRQRSRRLLELEAHLKEMEEGSS